MASRHLVSIAFTPSWLRVAHIEVSTPRAVKLRGSVARRHSVDLHEVPLPVGCINRNSGAIEDLSALQDAMKVSGSLYLHERRCLELFVVIPQMLCYRAFFAVPADLACASLKDVLVQYPLELPGDRSMLVTAAHAHAPCKDRTRSAMVLAARSSALEEYVRLFQGLEWSLSGITTGEIARYNRWHLQRPGISSQVVLMCSSDTDSYELSVWDCGVLIASESRRFEQGERARGPGNAVGSQPLGAHREQLAHDISALIDRYRELERPIEVIVFGGGLSRERELLDSLSGSSGASCEVSCEVDRYMQILDRSATGCGPGLRNTTALGLFDDAIGAIAPRMLSVNAKIHPRRNDYD
jgi:hypothetical protein